ncbi:DUF6801 domain-containing protein [Streptomyces sp. NBC_00083]|uniref:DUF6801 domain-containing protein n=1 Tax=Streptomyces sp. NBC_00083 TaxID=2975647 RepID=UPI00225199DD|nr:DUF6801 domain-containing protein [Streptomyces sp. NBC_00083]MCX5386700.1 hypothetical protein [Streptomyces sp. NBC_00083]
MSRTPGPAGRWRSVRSRGAVAAATVVLAAIVPGADVALGDQRADAELAYTCAFPGGPHPVKVQVAARFPARAATGTAIRPAEVTTSVTLPDAAVAELTRLRAATTGATTRLTTEVAQNGASAQALWLGTAPAVPLTPSGGAVFRATGEVPTVTAGSAGDLTVTAAGLTLVLRPVTTEGGATDPATLSVPCTPDPGAKGLLATVPVGAAISSPSPTPSTSATGDAAGAEHRTDPESAPRIAAPKARAAAATTAPRCQGDTTNPLALAAYTTGYSNVTKLGGASLIPVFCAKVVQGPNQLKRIEVRPGVFELHLLQNSVGRLDYEGRAQTPPGPATFLTFGFMPTTATMTLEANGPLSIESDLNNTAGHGETYIRASLMLRISDVKVNGTPLDVGPNCRTAGPVYSSDPDPARNTKDHMVLLGELKKGTDTVWRGYSLSRGGPLDGTVTIPPFTGCGVGEDLSPLFTTAVSGPSNTVKQNQGAPCASGIEDDPAQLCTADKQPTTIPTPLR